MQVYWRNKLYLIVIFVLIFAVILAGCSEQGKNDAIVIYAGIGLKEPLQKVAQEFSNKYKCEVNFTFSNYETLTKKIEDGSKPDIFIAPPSYMEDLKGKVVSDYCQKLTVRVPVMVVAKKNPKSITSLEDLTKPDVKLALPDQVQSHIVGGCVGDEILKKAKLSEKVHLIKPAPTTIEGLVKAVTDGSADATIIWNDQVVKYDNGDITVVKLPQFGQAIMCALLKEASNRKDSEKFLDFIYSQKNLF